MSFSEIVATFHKNCRLNPVPIGLSYLLIIRRVYFEKSTYLIVITLKNSHLFIEMTTVIRSWLPDAAVALVVVHALVVARSAPGVCR